MQRKMRFTGFTLSLMAASAAFAADHATKDEAVAMVKKTITEMKSTDPETVYKVITAHDPRFIDRDLYVVVYDMKGVILAHGANPKMVGRDQSDAEDVDGKPYGKERQELAKNQAPFWISYKFFNPVTKKIEPKQLYCETADQTIVCGGIYSS